MTLKIATVQLSAGEFGVRNVEKYLAKADERGADIICFPEGYLSGYTRDSLEAESRAIDLSSKEFATVLSKLEGFHTTAIIGVIEIKNSRLFNTAIVVRMGRVVGKYRKTHPQEGIFMAGTTYPTFDIQKYRFGINICYDANFPEASQKLVAQGAEIIFFPLNNELGKESAEKWRYKHIENLVKRAQETGAWIVSSDVTMESDETISYGCTAIVSPKGEIVEKMAEFEQGLLLATVTAARISNG